MAAYTPRPGSKIEQIINYMKANADKDMATVCTGMLVFVQTDMADCRSYYRWCVKNDVAPGEIVAGRRGGRKPNVTLAQPTTTSAKPTVTTTKPTAAKAELKSAEEISAIRAANLKRMKAVTASKGSAARKAKPEGEGVEDFSPEKARAEVAAMYAEMDAMDAPAALSHDDVRALV
jgi:hypothetical protein